MIGIIYPGYYLYEEQYNKEHPFTIGGYHGVFSNLCRLGLYLLLHWGRAQGIPPFPLGWFTLWLGGVAPFIILDRKSVV